MYQSVIVFVVEIRHLKLVILFTETICGSVKIYSILLCGKGWFEQYYLNHGSAQEYSIGLDGTLVGWLAIHYRLLNIFMLYFCLCCFVLELFVVFNSIICKIFLLNNHFTQDPFTVVLIKIKQIKNKTTSDSKREIPTKNII